MRNAEQVEMELGKVREEKNKQFWTFSRSARGKPVDPALCRREVELEIE